MKRVELEKTNIYKYKYIYIYIYIEHILNVKNKIRIHMWIKSLSHHSQIQSKLYRFLTRYTLF